MFSTDIRITLALRRWSKPDVFFSNTMTNVWLLRKKNVFHSTGLFAKQVGVSGEFVRRKEAVDIVLQWRSLVSVNVLYGCKQIPRAVEVSSGLTVTSKDLKGVWLFFGTLEGRHRRISLRWKAGDQTGVEAGTHRTDLNHCRREESREQPAPQVPLDGLYVGGRDHKVAPWGPASTFCSHGD